MNIKYTASNKSLAKKKKKKPKQEMHIKMMYNMTTFI